MTESEWRGRKQRVDTRLPSLNPISDDLEAALEQFAPIAEDHLAHGHMYLRFDPETQKPAVTLLKAKDVDTGSLPSSKHVEFEELVTALGTLTELIENFQQLAGFKPAGIATTEEESP